ncbi:UNVERIFIED_CONTAM: hypothetical protein PYX00_001626 [Menopon gallinae]|uniref:Uncharacterized protein n=1 Tax=Menopon gallinae TaxID=328185 RepID=A0AAW2IER1_9NEOP
MSSKGYSDLHERLRLSDNTWEEEIKRLKRDIKKTENRIIMTEKRRKLLDKSPCDLDLNLSGENFCASIIL